MTAFLPRRSNTSPFYRDAQQPFDKYDVSAAVIQQIVATLVSFPAELRSRVKAIPGRAVEDKKLKNKRTKCGGNTPSNSPRSYFELFPIS